MQMINHRMKTMDMSGGLYEIYQKALEMENGGASIIHMEIGKPDYDSPQVAKDALKKALDEGFVHYTAMAGISQLRHAIADKEARENGMIFDPETEIVVTAGACEALLALMLTALNPGDEILIPSPFFSAYMDMAHIAGITIKEVPLRFENAFELKTEDLETAVSEKTRAVLINTPHNPTGAVIGREELERIAAFAKEHDLLVISDETYDQFLFDGRHVSISTLQGMKERTVIINSTSKTFSMTGWRVGYAIGPRTLMGYLNKVHQNMSTCATSFAQVGAAAAYNHGRAFTEEMVAEFRIRRDMVMEGLREIRGIDFVMPQGAFYIFPRIVKLGISSDEFCSRALTSTGVAMTPGNGFGSMGEGFIRLSYACSREQISIAMKRLKRFVDDELK